MIKQIAMTAIAVGLLALLPMQQSYAQYVDNSGGSTGTTTKEQLARCDELGINRGNCNDNTILAAERVKSAEKTTYGNAPEGSGTSWLAGGLGQMIGFIGVLGAIFGSIASVFFVMGRKARKIAA